MLRTSLLTQNRKENTSVNTCDKITALALLMAIFTFLNSLLYFPYKFFIAKIQKESKSVNTGYMVTVRTSCTSPHDPLSVYQVSLNYLYYF